MAEGYTASFTTNTCSYDYFVQDDAMGLDRSKVKKKKEGTRKSSNKVHEIVACNLYVRMFLTWNHQTE